MRILAGISIILSFLIILGGCSSKVGDMVVLEVGNNKITVSEYENFFTRNSGGWSVAQKSTLEEREHFLDLLTNYKLKLQDAYDRNLVNDSDIVQELRDYRASLASTYMVEREITEPGVKQLYNRRKEEIRAQHILIKLNPDASPEDTTSAYIKAMDIIQRAKAGENFDSLVLHHSEDPSAKSNSGDLYYFTGGQMVGPFENAAFSMKKGEISSTPARSVFGYHIIKVNDRQPVRGTIRVSHIMTRFQVSATDSADTAAALSRVKNLHDSLMKGSDFDQLAVKSSEDGGSAPNGGDLGWFSRRRFVQPFDEAAFKLKVGEISNIVRTPFGYHIIRCDSGRPMPSFSEMRDELRKTYQQQRYNDDYGVYIAQLKKDFQFTFNENVFTDFFAHLDSTKRIGDSAWADDLPQDLKLQTIFNISGRAILLDTVILILDSKPEYRNIVLRASELKPKFNRIADGFLLETKSIGLEQRNSDFASLMKEYTDGILLYKAEQIEVWNKTTVSDSALKDYYNQNLSKFMFPERVNISVLMMDTDTTAYFVYDSIKQGVDFAHFIDEYKEIPPSKFPDGSRGLQPVETDELTRYAATLSVGTISEPFQTEDLFYVIIKVNAKEPARQKTFEEAGAEVSNTYQEYFAKQLERRWLDNVKLSHPVKQNKEILPKAFSSAPPVNE
ncbi:MAG: peptidylprolyl isomerase [Bacteroidota bacterium]|nr:peptidylprolyl isomerase [Bacteroidota bacterium]